MTQETITITIEQAKTVAEALEWMSEDIDSFHYDACEYDDEPDKATAELEAKQKRYDEAAAIINAKIIAATC